MGLFGQQAASGATRKRRPTSAVIERIRNILGIQQLDIMPTQAARAFQLASDPNSQSKDFIGVVESDEVLSARIIRIANSVYFFRGTAANDIERAVANIGLEELRCLLSATMLKSLLAAKHGARDQLWANSVGTGICARNLARLVNMNPGEAFLCGLLHDIGKLVMIRRAGRYYDRVLNIVAAEGKSFIDAEEKVFELNHVEVGRWVGEESRFPPCAVEAIATHHDPWPKTTLMSPGLLVKCANAITHACGIGLPGSFHLWQERCREELPTVLTFFPGTSADHEQFINNFATQFDREFGLYQAEHR